MAEKKPAKKTTQRSAKRTTTTKSEAFTAEERAAMKARAQELKAEARANKNKADGERDLLASIAAMKGRDRAMAKRLHAIVTSSAPDLSCRHDEPLRLGQELAGVRHDHRGVAAAARGLRRHLTEAAALTCAAEEGVMS
ncbi:MAG: hypothetical protein WEA10_07875 [Actinomycetota bacterium]